MKRIKINIEEFFEKHSDKIQILIFLLSLLIGAYFDICQENQLGIVIGLLFLITSELITLNVKDSITQRKLNNLGVRFEISKGALFRIHNFNLTDFFENTRKSFFVSGMALNGFFGKNKAVIENFLKEGKTIYILLADPESVNENAKLYHGTNLEESMFRTRVNDLFYKQLITLNCICEMENIYGYIADKKIQLRVAKSIISTSFVAYDIFEKELLTHNKNKVGKELKASFYQYRCTEPENEPNIIVDSFLNRDWYVYFRETIEKQWNDAVPISDEIQMKKLYETINAKIAENNNF